MRLKLETRVGANRRSCTCWESCSRSRRGLARKVTVAAEAKGEGAKAAQKVEGEDFGVKWKEVVQFFDVVLSLKPKRCASCLGTGYVVCDLCRGRGKTGGLLTETKGVECETCKGEGCVCCGSCNATGIANFWLFQPAKDPGWGPRGEL